jgi:tRNA U55 pseudouridine synthase TruB
MLSKDRLSIHGRLIQMSIFLSSRSIQMPPAFSAYQQSGKPLMELTRKIAIPVELGRDWVSVTSQE